MKRNGGRDAIKKKKNSFSFFQKPKPKIPEYNKILQKKIRRSESPTTVKQKTTGL